MAPKDENLIEELNEAGGQGWEVIAARRATSSESGHPASYEVILKRRGATMPENKK